jgi:hypothetical protein
MRIQIKWLLTGNVTPLTEQDDLLGPNTSILEVKGLIQGMFGFPAKDILLVCNHVLENHSRLRDVGIVDQNSADRIILTAHVVRSDSLEGKNPVVEGKEEAEEDDGDDNGIMEFTHEDMIMAMRMLGKEVPVGEDRLAELRSNAPRAAPEFVRRKAQQHEVASPKYDETPPVPTASASSEPSSQTAKEPVEPQREQKRTENVDPSSSASYRELVSVLQNMKHGLRREGVDQELAIKYPTVKEPYAYWDFRLPADHTLQHGCGAGNIVVELFFFGEYDVLDKAKFQQLVVALLDREGVRSKAVGSVREAGCMYPLVAVPLLVSVVDGWALGRRVFESFGVAPAQNSSAGESASAGAPMANPAGTAGAPGGKQECVCM